jgi:hypothetical protein
MLDFFNQLVKDSGNLKEMVAFIFLYETKDNLGLKLDNWQTIIHHLLQTKDTEVAAFVVWVLHHILGFGTHF